MERVWHRYETWEDYINGMYSNLEHEQKILMRESALSLMKDIKKFHLSMLRAVYEWPIASEHNLTSVSSNRRAWVGQAALAIEIGCPEDLTRLCWGELTNKERRLANRVADRVIEKWEMEYETKNLQLHFYVGKSGLQARNTGRSRPEDRGNGARALISENMQGYFGERPGANVIGF